MPDENVSLRDGAVSPWAKSTSPYYAQTLEALGKVYGFKLGDRFSDLQQEAQDAILHGTGSKEITFSYDDGLRSYKTTKTFEGVIPNLERRWKETESAWMREEIERFMSATPCPACNGYRLKPESLAVKIAGKHIGQVSEMSIRKADQWFTDLPGHLSAKQNEIAVRILKEIRERLRFLNDVGLDYLTMSRNSGTLSGGESQRIRLASQIGSGLTGVLYVLDEPSIGLHQRDNARLLDTLKHLRDLGNTVIVVEHDEDAILTADYVVDIGPAAGIHGGQVIAEGSPRDIMANPNSITGKYLSGELEIATPPARRQIEEEPAASSVVGARGNNLKNVTADIPIGALHRRHRRVGRRQVDLPDRDAVQGGVAPHHGLARASGRPRPRRGAGVPRQGHRHRPEPDRPHAALQPGDLHRRLHADPRLVRQPAGGQGARLPAGPLLLQRQGRPLRGLPGRRRHQDRDALPARRLRHLRRLPRQALQPRDARRAVQGQVDRRRARHDGRGRRRLLRRGARRARQARSR